MLFFNCLTKKCKKAFENYRQPFKRSRSYRFFDKALNSYLEEVDIVNFINDLRYLKKATKELMSKEPAELSERVKKNRRKTSIKKALTLIELTENNQDDEEILQPVSNQDKQIDSEFLSILPRQSN